MITAFKLVHSAIRSRGDDKDTLSNMNFSRTNPYPTSNMNNTNNKNNSPFPTIPSSLSTGDHGMRGDYAAQDAPESLPRRAVHSLEDVRPYLGLRSRLSQVWINRWTILILLVLVRVLIAIGNLHDDIDNAKDNALSACRTVESLGSNMASMPHYLSDGVNQLAAHGVEKAVTALHNGLFDVVTAAEEIFVFWINMLYGVYECLITFAVTGALHGVIALAEDITNFLNSTLGAVGDNIGNALNDFNTALSNFEDAFNSVSSVFTGQSHPPAKLDLSSEVAALHNLQLPTSIHDELDKLNNSIPNFDEVHNFTNSVLRLPFEEVKKLMNESLGVFQFNKTLLPVPQRTQLSFCEDSDGVNDFFDSLYDVANTARKIFIGTLLLAAVIACLPMGYMEIRRWRSMKQYASRMQVHAVDNIDAVYIASRPWTAWGGIKVGEKFGSNRARILARWFVAYLTSIPALVLLSLALAGLFSCLCQYAILKAVEKEVPALAADVGQFADKIVDALNDASAKWANGTNTIIMDTNNDINTNVFGWVNKSTTAVNDTLNTFVNETIGVLNATFGGTILYEPILEVYNCLIGMKVAAIEKGLTWVSDHAYIEFPMFPNDTFSAGAAAALTTDKTTADGQNNSFLADPSDQSSDKITETVTKLANKFAEAVRTEALLSTALLSLYLIIVLMGLARVAYSMMRAHKSRGEGGVSYAGDVAPGAVEDTTNNRDSLVASGSHHQAANANTTFQQRNVPAPAGSETPLPPPVYEPPRSSMRWPKFQQSGNGGQTHEEAEEAYQNEKMGFASTSTAETSVSRGFGHARQSSYAEVVDERPVREKGFL